ncbi:MAG: hypothetical protein RIA69_09180 [Cyclobacteriaceae bacterium]
MSDQLSYQFRMIRLHTVEFAILEKNYQDQQQINVNTNLSFAARAEHRLVAVSAKFTFEIKEQPFIVIKVEGQFAIGEETWEQMLTDEQDGINVPQSFMAHLSMLVVGSSRGVLHAKLENTTFNQFLIPTINVKSMIKHDIKVILEDKESNN